jgi:hypothetical protein
MGSRFGSAGGCAWIPHLEGGTSHAKSAVSGLKLDRVIEADPALAARSGAPGYLGWQA